MCVKICLVLTQLAFKILVECLFLYFQLELLLCRKIWRLKKVDTRSTWMYFCFHGSWLTRILVLALCPRAHLGKSTWLRTSPPGREWPANWWVVEAGIQPVFVFSKLSVWLPNISPAKINLFIVPALFCLFKYCSCMHDICYIFLLTKRGTVHIAFERKKKTVFL